MSQKQSKQPRLRPAALSDLENIWDFTARRWSSAQADEYVRGLYSAFDRIAQNPGTVRERIEFSPSVRICTFKSHIIVFREEADHIAIIRIRHGSEDWAIDPANES